MVDIADLERRVIALEAAVESDRTENKTMFEWIVGAFGRVNGDMEKMRAEMATKAELAAVKADVAGLRRDMPKIVADALREVMQGKL